ncbi:MAG: CocE/NonD family hydrolase [Pseudomonadota bacterium]
MIIDRDLGIMLPDGTRLSAKIWRPESSQTEPVPAILEYLPYRKSDGTAARDETMHPWFASRGYACLRVDRRGCGDSEGVFDDEYSEQELQDGENILRWIAAQPWCTGHVGMQGISWGGFNGVQLAARAPEPLKAVISIGTTVDRFHDDIHYKGGIQLGENIGWAATATSWCAMPPDPALAGPNWRDAWLTRLAQMPFMAKIWAENSDRNTYWKHGSVCETFEKLSAPVLVMGGLHDGYRNAMAAMVENLSCVAKGVAGPWSHKYPHISTIGPSIDYHNLALRWWDRWLKGKSNGAENDPAMRTYVMDSIAPDDSLSFRPGHWVADQSWSSEQVDTATLPFGHGVLGAKDTFSARIETKLACGQSCGEFFPFGFGGGELPGDQSLDDALSTCFESVPFDEDRTILGAPTVKLRVSADATCAQLIVRLCDLRPDGSSALISMGLLNLRHRDGFDQKTPLEPGQTYDVSLRLDHTAYRLPAGHRVRVAISGSYWPYCWPEDRHFTLTLTEGSVDLPIRKSQDAVTYEFEPPIDFPRRQVRQLRPNSAKKSWTTDANGNLVLEIVGDQGQNEDVETGLITQSTLHERWSIHPDDPATAQVDITWTRGLSRGDWKTSTKLTAQMRGEKDMFSIRQTLEAWEDADLVFSDTQSARVPR